MLSFSVTCWHLFVVEVSHYLGVELKNERKQREKGKQWFLPVNSAGQLIQYNRMKIQKQKTALEQKFSASQISIFLIFGNIGHFFPKEVSGKISRWWMTAPGRVVPPRNKQANTNINNESKNEALLHWLFSPAEWYQCYNQIMRSRWSKSQSYCSGLQMSWGL